METASKLTPQDEIDEILDMKERERQRMHDRYCVCNCCKEEDLSENAWEVKFMDTHVEYVCEKCLIDYMHEFRNKIVRICPYTPDEQY